MKGSVSSLLRNKKAKLVDKEGIKQIEWKQDSVMGVGGDKHQSYRECIYSLEDNEDEESKLPIFIQDGKDIPDVIEFDWKLQYGLTNGTIFFVLHDKALKPYQHRFVPNESAGWLFTLNNLQKKLTGLDFSWIRGDYLHDFYDKSY